jgi:hypothetical protein
VIPFESLFRRFFAAKRRLSEEEIGFFLNVDFTNHVALVAVVEEGERPVIVGGGRYIVVQPGKAEVAFAALTSTKDGVSARRRCATLLRLPVVLAFGNSSHRFCQTTLQC